MGEETIVSQKSTVDWLNTKCPKPWLGERYRERSVVKVENIEGGNCAILM